MNPDLAPYRDPELVATLEQMRAKGVSASTLEAAERYIDADAEFSKLLRMPLDAMTKLAREVIHV